MKDSIIEIIKDLESQAQSLDCCTVDKWEDTPEDIARINREIASRLRAIAGIAVVEGKQKLGGVR